MKKDLLPKVRVACLVAVTAACIVLPASADPILPYAQPIAAQLDTEIAALEATNRTPEQDRQLSADRSALNTYGRTSKNLGGDVSILRTIDRVLTPQGATFANVLSNAVSGYIVDFQARNDALREELVVAPLSRLKTNAINQLNANDIYLASAASQLSVGDRDLALRDLGRFAAKMPKTSNSVERALNAKIKYSSVVARIGKLQFKADLGSTFGGLTNGVLDLVSIDNGTVVRGLQIHVEGVTTNTPATYALGVGDNTATYSGTDVERKQTFTFYALPSGTVSTNGSGVVVTNTSQLTIEAFTTNFITGTFRFGGTSGDQTPGAKTTHVDVTNGLFQLNY